MMRNFNGKILIALVLTIFLSLSPETWAGTILSPEIIRETALNFLTLRSQATVGQIKLWQDASLSDPVPYHDFFGNIIAY